jgi:large subunit ribosomal protein L10
MAVTKEQKDDILKGLKDQFSRAQGVVFAEFRGLSVEDAQTLRRGLREAGLEYKVAKKTLIKLAAKENGYDLSKDVLEGPIGVAFGFDDEILAAQKMAEFAKKFEGLTLKGGIMEGKVIDVNMVNTLALIPSRDTLLAKFMGSAMSPLTGFVGIGNALVGGFVRVVNAYQEQRAETEGAPEPAPAAEPEKEEEAPKEEAPAEEVKADEAPAEDAAAPEADAPAENAKPEDAPAEEAEATPDSDNADA